MRYTSSLPIGDPTETEELSAAAVARSVSELVYTHFSENLIPLIPKDAVRILDIGCGCGNFGERVKQSRDNSYIVGITISEAEARRAAGRLDEVWLCDLNTFDLGSVPPFDVIVCSHALGYFADTKGFLGRLRAALKPDGRLLLSVPNVVNFKQRWQFFCGRFRYQERGVLEQFYLRFFDRFSLRNYVTDSGFQIIYWEDEGYLPQPVLRRLSPRLATMVDRWVVALSPGFFGHTFHLSAQIQDSSHKVS